MNYLTRVLISLLLFFNNRLSFFEKIIYSVLGTSLIVVTLISLVQKYPYYFAIIISLILIIAGFYLFITSLFRRHQVKVKKINNKNNDEQTFNRINTNGGNYNGLIQGNYVQGDYINIQETPVDISHGITQTMDEFREILMNMVNQGYSTEEAVEQITNELLEEIRRKPEIKSKLLIDENASDNEIAEEFINILIRRKYFINRQSSQRSNYMSDDYEETIYYKGYAIHLEADKDDNWYYKIDGLLFYETGKSFSKSSAIDEAKGKIDEERFRNW
ncbi:hypothetical protein BLD44_019170 [Mastigocladus laminosus UU774]|nr:hypothetical protein BLD44_019170 [Mastigocladus laminosus UU774]